MTKKRVKGTKYEINRELIYEEKYDELVQLATFLLTDGGMSRDKNTYVIYFTNRSEKLQKQFRLVVKEIIPNVHFRTSVYKKVVRTYVNSIELAELLFKLSNTYRTAPCESYPSCALLRGKPELKPCKVCIKRFDEDNIAYPTASFPIIDNSFMLREILRIIADTEGGPSFLIRRKPRYIRLVRRISIACHHPTLREQITQMLFDLGIQNRYNSGSIIIEGYAIEYFHAKIGFSRGVKLTRGTYQGYDKQSVLEIMTITNKLIKKRKFFPSKIENLKQILENSIKLFEDNYSRKQVTEYLLNC